MRYFIDTEFIERGPGHPIKFLSIGIVADDGRELYCEIGNASDLIRADFALYRDPWLRDNVLPHLGSHGMTRAEIKQRILAFIGDDKPEFWAYFADYDWVVMCQLFGRMIDLPKGWPMYCRDLKQRMDDRGFGRDLLPEQGDAEHSALNDARWVRAAWLTVMKGAAEHPADYREGEVKNGL